MSKILFTSTTRSKIQATRKVIHTAYPRIIYVIELDPAAALDPVFAKENPHLLEGMPCLYVGSSSKTAAARLEQHLAGENAARIVALWGRKLRFDLMPDQKPIKRERALMLERNLARDLRRQGFAVSQH